MLMMLLDILTAIVASVPGVLLYAVVVCVLYLIDDHLQLNQKSVIGFLALSLVVLHFDHTGLTTRNGELQKNLTENIEKVKTLEDLVTNLKSFCDSDAKEQLEKQVQCMKKNNELEGKIKKSTEKLSERNSELEKSNAKVKSCKEELQSLNEINAGQEVKLQTAEYKLNTAENEARECKKDYIGCIGETKVGKEVCEVKLKDCRTEHNSLRTSSEECNTKLVTCQDNVDPMKVLLLQVQENSKMMKDCSLQKPYKKEVQDRGFFSSNSHTEEQTVSPHCDTVSKEYSKIFEGIARLMGAPKKSKEIAN